MNNVREQLSEFIVAEFALEPSELQPDDDLLSQGTLDSMGVLQIVAFVEKSFSFRVADEEIVPENFQSLNALTDFVRRKTSTHSAEA